MDVTDEHDVPNSRGQECDLLFPPRPGIIYAKDALYQPEGFERRRTMPLGDVQRSCLVHLPRSRCSAMQVEEELKWRGFEEWEERKA